jgi:ABC-type spermidine/putrescine transport system permease subunit II
MRTRPADLVSALVLLAIAGFLLLPVCLVVLFGFHSSGRLNLPFEGFSLQWYGVVRDAPEYQSALTNSLVVALGASAVTLAIGTLAAFGYGAVPPKSRTLVGMLFFAPIALPPLFLGLALLSALSQIDAPLSLWTVAIGHIVFCFPYFFLISRSAVERLDPDLEHVAADLGASPSQTFRTVTLPLIWPILLAATVLTFAISFDEFIITFFVIGADSTVPMVLWSTMRRSVDPTINVLATILLLATAIGAITAAAVAFGRRTRGTFIQERQ